jgi:hypothetical protein
MATATQTNLTELYRNALEQFESALKTGVKIQEESIKMLTSWAKEPPLMPDWTQKAQANFMEAISAMPERYEEAMRLMNEHSKNAMELLHKGFEAGRSTNLAEAQENVRELWEMTLGVLRNNIHSLLKTQSKAVQKWEEVAGCMGGTCESKGK